MWGNVANVGTRIGFRSNVGTEMWVRAYDLLNYGPDYQIPAMSNAVLPSRRWCCYLRLRLLDASSPSPPVRLRFDRRTTIILRL